MKDFHTLDSFLGQRDVTPGTLTRINKIKKKKILLQQV